MSLVKRRVSKIVNRIKQIVFFDESQVVYNGKTFKQFYEECAESIQHSVFSDTRIKLLVRKEFLKEGFRPDECILYGFEKRRERDRNLFLSQRMKDQLMISYYGSDWRGILNILKDKYVFYSYLKDFFKRDVTYIKSSEDRRSFLSFCNKHHQVFAKLNKGNCGNGARSLTIKDEEQAGRFFDELVSSGEWIIEELINQDPAISIFNSSSINTIRFPSFKKDGIVKCVYPCMRFGRAGSIVDNAGQGGVFVSIDQNTGEIISDAFDEKGNLYVVHPDSKVPFRGFHVPQWENLVESVKKAHLALPDSQVYVAFDFALSDKGWCIVEGNWGDWILQQTSLQKGFKNEFISLLKGN